MTRVDNFSSGSAKGHRLVGGISASIYNAMPPVGVMTRVDFRRDFGRRHG